MINLIEWKPNRSFLNRMDLSGLPLDIRFLILTQPSLLPLSPYVPGELGRRASKVYYQKYGEVAISKSEIAEYIRGDRPQFIASISFGTLRRHTPSRAHPPDEWDKWYRMDVDMFVCKRNSTPIQYQNHFGCAGIRLYIDGNVWKAELYQSPHMFSETSPVSDVEEEINKCCETIDLYSQYQILRRRCGCMRINPLFAVETVRQMFEKIINDKFQTWSPYPILNQLKLFLWLDTNTQCIPEILAPSDSISISLPPPIIARSNVTIITEPLPQEDEVKMDFVKIRNQEMIAQLRSLMSEWQ